MESTPHIGWIGTGVMGASMAGHLLSSGYPLSVYTRSPEKAADLISRGATWCETPQAVADRCSVLCTMVGHPSDLREVLLGPDGALAVMEPGSLLIDFTTSSPALAEELFETAAQRDIETLDAPVSGGDIGAQNAQLSIMVGGTESAFARALPLFERMGKTIVHQGPAGAGQHTKMVNQTVVASSMVGICEALLYAQRSGLDPLTVLKSVGGGAASSWALNNLWPRMIDQDYAPGFYVEHFIKDMGIALEECTRMNIELPGLALGHALYEQLQQFGHGRDGTQALLLALEKVQPAS